MDPITLIVTDLAAGAALGVLMALPGADGGGIASEFPPRGGCNSGPGAGRGGQHVFRRCPGQPAGRPIQTSQVGVDGLAFSPDGRQLATDDGGTVRLWNPVTGQPIGAPIRITLATGMAGTAFSPDGKLLATIDVKGNVRLWNPATGQPAGTPIQTSEQLAVDAVAFSPDGGLLATAGRRRHHPVLGPGHRPARRRGHPDRTAGQ